MELVAPRHAAPWLKCIGCSQESDNRSGKRLLLEIWSFLICKGVLEDAVRITWKRLLLESDALQAVAPRTAAVFATQYGRLSYTCGWQPIDTRNPCMGPVAAPLLKWERLLLGKRDMFLQAVAPKKGEALP